MAASEMAPVFGMIILTSTVTSFVLQPDCSPGFHLESGDCKECPPGQFTDVHNQFIRCSAHRDCKESEIATFEGNSTRDRVCTCKHGGRDYYNYDELYGYDCRSCTGGNVPRPVLNPRYQGDVACCPPHHQAHRNIHGAFRCSREAAPASQPPSSDGSQDHKPPADEDSLDKLPYIVGFTILGLFIIGIVAASACYVRHKRRSNNTNSARIAACETSENDKDSRKESVSIKSKEYALVPSE